jgi:hypothetical protein
MNVVNIIGSGLDWSVVVDARELFNDIVSPDVLTILDKPTLSDVLEYSYGADIIHFTCHSFIENGPSLQLRDDDSTGLHCLTLIDVGNLPQIADCVVFANACSAASTVPFWGELRSFGWEFYKKGAANFIAPLGLISPDYATPFAKEFYEKLSEDHPVGEALYKAKSDVFEAESIESKKENPLSRWENPFWLLYVLYGNPFTKKLN